MNENLSPLRNKKAVAILSIGTITILASMAVSPALGAIKTVYSNISDTLIQMVLVIPTFFIIPACFLCLFFCNILGAKKTLILGLLLYLFGGVCAGFVSNFYMMLIFRGILGIGCGLILPLAQKLISDNFSGEIKEKIIGYPVSASCLMGIIASFSVGFIASIYWRLAFLVYLMAFIVLYLNIKYLPNDTPVKIKQKKVKISFLGVKLIFSMALANLSFYTFPTYIALFMKSESIGIDSSSGIIVSVLMGAGFLTGINAIHIRKILKKYSPVFAVFCIGVGYILMSVTSSIPVLYLCAILIGGSYNLIYTEIFSGINKESAKANNNTTLITYTTVSMFIGQTLSVPLLEFASKIFSDSSYRFKFEFLSILSFLTFIVLLINVIKERFLYKISK